MTPAEPAFAEPRRHPACGYQSFAEPPRHPACGYLSFAEPRRHPACGYRSFAEPPRCRQQPRRAPARRNKPLAPSPELWHTNARRRGTAPTTDQRCGSSVVEHSLGKGEVESSILSRSTIFRMRNQRVIGRSQELRFRRLMPAAFICLGSVRQWTSDGSPLLERLLTCA